VLILQESGHPREKDHVCGSQIAPVSAEEKPRVRAAGQLRLQMKRRMKTRMREKSQKRKKKMTNKQND
jgi:hypothetical protein